MKECTTHHHACDCREAKFAELEQQLAELSKHANAMATSVGCTSKAFRDYWDYVEQKGVSSDE